MATYVVNVPTYVTVVDTQTQVVAQPVPPAQVVRSPVTEVVIDTRTQQLITAGVQGLPGVQGPPGPAGGSAFEAVAAEILGGHRVVRSTGTSTVGYASRDNPAHGDDTVGLTLGAAVAGATVNVQTFGAITHAGWAWTPGEPVFLGTNGLPTQVPPDAGFSQIIGHAADVTTLFVDIQPPIYF